jgi:hypothetical protein
VECHRIHRLYKLRRRTIRPQTRESFMSLNDEVLL